MIANARRPPVTLITQQARHRTQLPLAFLGARGEVEWVSDALAELCQRPAAALVGQCASALATGCGLGADELAAAGARLRAGDAVRVVVQPGSVLFGEREVEVAVQPLPEREGGAAGFVVVATDLGERRLAEAALRESEDRYRRLVEACPEPIVVHGGGRVRFINPAGLALLGATSADEVLGRPILEFVHPDFHGIVAERVRKMEETGEGIYLLEEKILRLDGSVRDVEIAGAPVIFQGEPAIQLVGRDVTDRRREEEERRRLQERVREARRRESLATVAAGVAHRLGELSDAIVGATDRALAEGAAGLHPGALQAIRSSGLRMAALTDKLLAFAGRRPGQRRRVDLSSLVVEISDRIDKEAGGCAIAYALPAGLPRVAVDALQLRRAVLGLVRNAADALGAGTSGIQVATGVRELDAEAVARVQPPDALAPGRYVFLDVSDRGCGMDAETRARSLDPFFTTKTVGRGLGLCEVLGVVRAQGGGIQVESEPGRGTTVTVLLPALPESPGSRRVRSVPRA
jgi:PAS domain S-box-containing protein